MDELGITEELVEEAEPIEGTEETAEETGQIVRNFATIGAVFEDGVTLIFDGEEAATEKHYLCNTSVYFSPGDRVRIVEDSGTYIVEYVVGRPKQSKTVGLPAGGAVGQVLKKAGAANYVAAWQNGYFLPAGGTQGQWLQKSSRNDGEASWASAHTIPAGGTSGQLLQKNSTSDGDVGWASLYMVPAGGTTGQVLTKDSNTAGDVSWQTPSTSGKLPTGGSSGQFLVKNASGDYAAAWQTKYTLPTGGNNGQFLAKSSATDGNYTWKDISVSGTLPTGGTTGQVLTKSGATNYAVGWETLYTLPTGGAAGQVLAKDSTTAGDVSWVTPSAAQITNQYNANAGYAIQFRTTATYGSYSFQIRMGSSGTWRTITVT